MMDLPDALVDSRVADVPLAGWVTDGLTVVVALERYCLASFSTSGVAMIEFSTAQVRSNSKLHAPKCPPGKT